MKLREIVRSLVREELPELTRPPTAAAVQAPPLVTSARQESLVRLRDLQKKAALIETKKQGLDDEGARLACLEAESAAVRARLGERQREWFADKYSVSFAIERETAFLRETCSPVLRGFIEAMDAELDRLRYNVEEQTAMGYGDKNLLADNPKKQKLTYSNMPAIKRRITAVLAARTRAEELKVLDRSDKDLSEELEGLRQALPAIDGELEVVMGE